MDLAASLEACDAHSASGGSNGMNSYFEREKEKAELVIALNPTAKEYRPALKFSQRNQTESPLSSDELQNMEVQQNQTLQLLQTVTSPQCPPNDQQRGSNMPAIPLHVQC